jgi:hypothetical protein
VLETSPGKMSITMPNFVEISATVWKFIKNKQNEEQGWRTIFLLRSDKWGEWYFTSMAYKNIRPFPAI